MITSTPEQGGLLTLYAEYVLCVAPSDLFPTMVTHASGATCLQHKQAPDLKSHQQPSNLVSDI